LFRLWLLGRPEVPVVVLLVPPVEVVEPAEAGDGIAGVVIMFFSFKQVC
jgi:hypothetical protein